jgi:hypothetical protein
MSIADQPSSKPVTHQPPIVPGLNAGPVEDFDALLGEGSDLWANDAEFAAFLAELRRWRKQDRHEIRPR